MEYEPVIYVQHGQSRQIFVHEHMEVVRRVRELEQVEFRRVLNETHRSVSDFRARFRGPLSLFLSMQRNEGYPAAAS